MIATGTHPLATVARLAREAPERPALTLLRDRVWQEVSYGALHTRLLRWARLCHAHRVREHSRARVVAIVLRHGLDAYAAYLGAMRAGLIPCFLPYPTRKQDPGLYWQDHRAVLARLDPLLVITYPALQNAIEAILPGTCPIVTAPEGSLAADALPALDAVLAPDAPALLQHSSGTTGLKKSVQLSHGQIARQLGHYAGVIDFTEADRVASWLPLYHDMGLIAAFLLPLARGGRIVAMDAFDWLACPTLLFEAIALFSATFCWLPNFALAHLVRTHDPAGPAYALGSIRAFIDCAEPCRPETLDEFRRCFAPQGLNPAALQTCYAMAETVFAVTQTALGEAPRTLHLDGAALALHAARTVDAATQGARAVLSCGRPIPGTELRIAPRAGVAPVPEAAPVGEILIRSDCAFDGYFGAPEATRAALADGWYRSGDLGFLHDGELYVTGRTKDLLIVHGRNFYAHDIEACAAAVEGVKPGRVVAFPEYFAATASEEAVVVAETDLTDDAERRRIRRALAAAIERRLSLVPRRIELVAPGELVKTTSGKLSREENRKRFAARRAA